MGYSATPPMPLACLVTAATASHFKALVGPESIKTAGRTRFFFYDDASVGA